MSEWISEENTDSPPAVLFFKYHKIYPLEVCSSVPAVLWSAGSLFSLDLEWGQCILERTERISGADHFGQWWESVEMCALVGSPDLGILIRTGHSSPWWMWRLWSSVSPHRCTATSITILVLLNEYLFSPPEFSGFWPHWGLLLALAGLGGLIS